MASCEVLNDFLLQRSVSKRRRLEVNNTDSKLTFLTQHLRTQDSLACDVDCPAFSPTIKELDGNRQLGYHISPNSPQSLASKPCACSKASDICKEPMGAVKQKAVNAA